MAEQPVSDVARKAKSQVSTAMYLHTMGLTDSACHDLGLIKTYEGVDSTMRRMIASIQFQGGYYDEVLKTLQDQNDSMSLLLRGKSEFMIGSFRSATAYFR